MSPAAPRSASGVRRSLVLETSIRLVFHAILVTSLFFLFAGHNSPGGGFIGGLVAGAAFVLRYLVGGDYAVGALRLRAELVLGAGLLTSGLASAVPWAFGQQVLQSSYVYLDIPVLGQVPLTSVLVFDSGVFLIVVGIVLTVLTTLGAQPQASLGEMQPDRDVPATGGELT